MAIHEINSTIQDQIEKSTKHIIDAVMVVALIFSLIGLFLNFLSFYYAKMMLRGPQHIFYIQALAVTGSFSILFDGIVDPIQIWIGRDFGFNTYLCAFEMALDFVSTYATNWIVVAITADRLIAVYMPYFYLHHSKSNIPAKVVVFLGTFVIYAINMPIIYASWHGNSAKECVAKLSGMFYELVDVTLWTNNTVPVIIVLIMSLAIAIKLLQKHRKAKVIFAHNESLSKDEQNALKMLLLVAVMFLILTIPTQFSTALHVYVSDNEDVSYELRKWSYILDNVEEVFHIVNSGCTFFLYLLGNKRFRKEFFKKRTLKQTRSTSTNVDETRRTTVTTEVD